MYICKHLCQETGGFYTVALDESHFKELVLEHVPPPPAIAEFAICGLTLVSSPHLASSYHHLFPITTFNEVASTILNNPHRKLPKTCFGCQQTLPVPGKKPSLRVACPKCNQHFCLDCDIYIHENLHNCPGCESQNSKAVTEE
ncbi:General transcription factor iih subunit [Thalictrum thalictroides]|uniref:General transcription factor IIH subunit 2 n=1 Tax=Thalictrum thalictroides TaxID=46969 RepID=A0A7J6VAD9_THATH|nr:General transcription factor iih subunit [Thalictrum thalictroides]